MSQGRMIHISVEPGQETAGTRSRGRFAGCPSHQLSVIILGLLLFVIVGCDDLRTDVSTSVPPPPSKPLITVNRVDNPVLAKLILKPSREKINIERDPFQPLLLNQDAPDVALPAPTPDFADWQVVGIIKSEDQYTVLLKNKKGRGVYRVNDKIQNFTIVSIDENQVVLSNGKNKVTMKRGGVK